MKDSTNQPAKRDSFASSFTACINGIRMQDAIRLIQDEPEAPVGVIAEAVGFTPANFREQFKRQFGMTPTEYRNNL